MAAARAKIKNDQLAHDCQHRNQNDGANMHDALLPLGYDQQGSAEFQCDDHGEHHAEEVLKRSRIRSVEGARLQHDGEHLEC
jgi:hypothetical protein